MKWKNSKKVIKICKRNMRCEECKLKPWCWDMNNIISPCKWKKKKSHEWILIKKPKNI